MNTDGWGGVPPLHLLFKRPHFKQLEDKQLTSLRGDRRLQPRLPRSRGVHEGPECGRKSPSVCSAGRSGFALAGGRLSAARAPPQPCTSSWSCPRREGGISCIPLPLISRHSWQAQRGAAKTEDGAWGRAPQAPGLGNGGWRTRCPKSLQGSKGFLSWSPPSGGVCQANAHKDPAGRGCRPLGSGMPRGSEETWTSEAPTPHRVSGRRLREALLPDTKATLQSLATKPQLCPTGPTQHLSCPSSAGRPRVAPLCSLMNPGATKIPGL